MGWKSKIMDHGYATLATWIREMCRYEPKVMRQISKSTFGNLHSWLEAGSKKVSEVCGCLVGTTALRLIEDRNSLRVKVTREDVHDIGDGDLYANLIACKKISIPSQFAADEKERFGYEDFQLNRGDRIQPTDAVAALVRGNAEFRRYMAEITETAGSTASDLGTVIGQGEAVEMIRSEINHWLTYYAAQKRRAKARKLAKK